MPTQDRMTTDEPRKYLRTMKKRYVKAGRKERVQLLLDGSRHPPPSQEPDPTGEGSLERKLRRKRRGRTYGPEVDDALCAISESLDHICADRLTSNLVWLLLI